MEFEGIKLQPAKEEDLEILMAWRSHPEVYRHFYQQKSSLIWKEHLNWWKTRQNREDWIILFNEDNRWRKIGSINVSKLNEEPEIGIFIGEVTLHGKGIGAKALSLFLNYIKEKGYKSVIANISEKNTASKAIFEKNGFEKKDIVREGEYQFRKIF